MRVWIRTLAFATALVAVPGPTESVRAQSGRDWIEVRTANFVVYTDTDQEKGERLVERLESVTAAYVDALFPMAPRPFPIRVVLFDDTDEYQRILPEAVRTALTLSDAMVAPHDAYLIRGTTEWFIAARDRSPDDVLDDVGHSLGHLFLARSVLWRPFWLQEAVGEFVRLVGRDDRDGDLDEDEAYPVGELLEIVPSGTFDDLGDGGPFRVSAYFLLRVLMANHPDALEGYFQDLGRESGFDATLRLTAEEIDALDAAILEHEDRTIPMATVAVEPEIRAMSIEEAFVVRGQLALASGFPTVARGYFQQGGSTPASRVGLALLAKISGPSASNRRAFEQLASALPDDAMVRFHLGTLDADSGVDTELRVSSLERAVQLEPGFGRAYAELGWAYLAAGRIEAAVDAANRAIALAPEYADRAFELIAETRFASGDAEGAREAMTTAATLPHIDPDTEEHYRLVVPDIYRRIESRERESDADRVAQLRRQLQARADDVDPRPEVIVGGPAPVSLVTYEVKSTPPTGVQQPRLVSGDMPEHPSELRRSRIDGEVELEVGLDRQGRVISTRVVSSPQVGLSDAVVDAVERWRFDPARSGNESIDFSFRILFRFDLQE